MPSIYDVANLAGVSLGSVSRVLRGAPNVGAKTRDKVLAAVKELDYRPNRIAQSLAQGQTRTLAMIVPDLSNPFFGEMAVGAQDSAAGADHVVLIYATNDDPETERRHILHLLDQRVDGMIIVDSVLEPKVTQALVGAVPTVHINHADSPEWHRVVGTDQGAASVEVIDLLVGLGHRRIALIGGPPAELGPRFRSHSEKVRRGYAAGLGAHGLTLDPDLIVEVPLSEAGGAEGMRTLLARTEFTAVFASTDMMALGAHSVLLQEGLRVPQDVSLVGYNDIRISPYIGPGLTTVSLPSSTLGARAVELALDPDQGPLQIVLPSRMVIRGSTAPVDPTDEGAS